MPSLALLGDLQAYLSPSPGPIDDTLLQRLLDGVSAAFEREIGYPVLSAANTEMRRGDGTRVLVLGRPNVTALSALTVDGIDVLADATREGSIVRLSTYRFTDGKVVSVTYTAGYSAVPADIVEAVLELAAIKYRERPHVGQQSQSLAGQAVTYLPAIVPRTVQEVVDRYWRPSV